MAENIIDEPLTDFEAFDERGIILATAGLQLDGSWVVWRVGEKDGRLAHDEPEAEEMCRKWGARRFNFHRGGSRA